MFPLQAPLNKLEVIFFNNNFKWAYARFCYHQCMDSLSTFNFTATLNMQLGGESSIPLSNESLLIALEFLSNEVFNFLYVEPINNRNFGMRLWK